MGGRVDDFGMELGPFTAVAFEVGNVLVFAIFSSAAALSPVALTDAMSLNDED